MTPKAWLDALCAAVPNPPSHEDREGRYKAISYACKGLDPSAWNPRTLQDAMQKCRLWPSAGEIYDLLAQWWRLYGRDAIEVGRRDWPALPSPEPAKASTDAEVDHVSSVVAEMVKDLHAQAKEREAKAQKSKAMPAHLPDLELLALYSEMGDAGAVRAAMLRRRLGLAS